MDMLELIKERRSIRVFTSDLPSRCLIRECLEASIWAPSPTNQQPWEFIVLAGEKLAAVNTCVEEHFFERMKGDGFGDLPGPCQTRKDEIMETISRVAEQDGINPAQFLRACSVFLMHR